MYEPMEHAKSDSAMEVDTARAMEERAPLSPTDSRGSPSSSSARSEGASPSNKYERLGESSREFYIPISRGQERPAATASASVSASAPALAPSKQKPKDRLVALLQTTEQIGAKETSVKIARLLKSIQQEKNRRDLTEAMRDRAPPAFLVASMSNQDIMTTLHSWLLTALRFPPEQQDDSSLYPILEFLGSLPVTSEFLFDPLGWVKTVKKCQSDKLVANVQTRALAEEVWSKWRSAAATMPDPRNAREDDAIASSEPIPRKRKVEQTADADMASKAPSKKPTPTAATVTATKAALPPITKRTPAVSTTAHAAVPSTKPATVVRKLSGPTVDTSFFEGPARPKPKLPTIAKREVPVTAAPPPAVAPTVAVKPGPTAFEKAMKSLDAPSNAGRDISHTLKGSNGTTAASSPIDVYAALMRDMDDREKQIVREKMAKNLDKKGRPRKSVRFRPDSELEQIKLVPVINYYADDEKVAGAQLPHQFGDARDLDRKEGRLAFHHFDDDDAEMAWHDLVEIELPEGKTSPVYGQASKERGIQEERERQILAAIYLDQASIPPSPLEPDTIHEPASGLGQFETKTMSLGTIEPDPIVEPETESLAPQSGPGDLRGLDLSALLSKLAPASLPTVEKAPVQMQPPPMQTQDPILQTLQSGGFDLSQIDPGALASVRQMLQGTPLPSGANNSLANLGVAPPHANGIQHYPNNGALPMQHSYSNSLPGALNPTGHYPMPFPPATSTNSRYFGQPLPSDSINNMMMAGMTPGQPPNWVSGSAAGVPPSLPVNPPSSGVVLPDQMSMFQHAGGNSSDLLRKGKKGAAAKVGKKGGGGLDPTLFRTRTCLLWRNGTCTFGDRCAYLHKEV